MNAPGPARRIRLSPRVITTMLAALVVALVGVLFLGAALAGELSAKSFWSASGVLVMVLVIAAVGLVVVRHQPRNPIGWLLAGESVFILLVIVAGFCATLMYRHGHHGLLVVGPAVLALSQLFSYSLIGFPLVILLFPDGRLPSRRWRWAMWAYLASTATVVLVTVIASVGIAMGQHVAIDGKRESRLPGPGRHGLADPGGDGVLHRGGGVLAGRRRPPGPQPGAAPPGSGASS